MPPATPNRNIALEQADVAVPNAPQNIVQVAPDAAPTEPDIAKIRASGCVRPADTMTYAQALVSDPTLNDGYTAFERNAIGLTEGPLPPGVTVTVTEVISTDDEAPATHDPVASPPSGTITDAAAIPIDGVGTTTESRVLASTETPISADDGWKNATPSSADAAAGWQTATSRCRKRVASRQASPEPGRQPVPTPTPQGRTGEAPSPANDEDTEWQIVHSRRGKRVAARRVTSDPGRQPVPDPITQAPTGEPVPFPASPENQRRNIVNYDKYARFGVMNSEPSSEPFFIEPNQPGPDMYTLPTGGPTIAIDLTATPDPFLKITKAPDSDKGTNMRILSVPQAVAPRTDEYDDMEKPVRPPYIKKVPANRDLAYTAALATFKAKADVTNAWIDDHSGDFDTPESYRDPRERRLAAARLIRHYPEAVDPDRVCLTAKEAFLDARLTVTEPPPSVHPDPAYADDEEGNDADDEGSDDNKGDDEKNDVEKGDDDESRRKDSAIHNPRRSQG